MSGPFVEHAVRARVPATSANLGPGFDALGLALGLHDEVTARVTAADLCVEVDGEASATVGLDESHLVVRAMRRCFAELGDQPPGLALECLNRIPHGRGLGSSAAAIVAGVLLARALVTDGAARLPDPAALALAAGIEGHPDNVAPCLLGGLTVAWLASDGSARAIRRDLDAAIVPVVLVPPFSASTELARGLLPATLGHGDAAFSAGRSALLVAALTGMSSARPESEPGLLLAATEDRLHQPFRAGAMPDSARLIERLRAAGHAAVISGAGPTVLVLTRGDGEAERVRAEAPDGWTGRRLPIDAHGASVAVRT